MALKDSELQKWVRAAAPIAGKSDGGGLTFTLSRAGTASWVFRYRHGGRQREMTLGNYPDVALVDARKKATAARALVDAGRDVAGEKRKERRAVNAAMSFCALFEDYLERSGKKLVPVSQAERRRFLTKDLAPRLGHLAARDVSPEDVIATVESIAKRSDSVARQAFGMLSVVFDHGVARRAVLVNPCRTLKLSAVLGDRPDPRPRLKLTRDELRAAFAGLPALGRVLALAVKILLATCVRKSELLHARKAEVDLGDCAWLVRAKGSKTFTVPLTPAVVGWFRELIALSGDSEWVLPSQSKISRREGKHLGKPTLNGALNRLRGLRHFSPHDLRSTARSHLAALGVEVIVAERCLNHSLGGLVGVYDQHDYMTERRRALELWTNLLVELETGERQNVVAMRPAA